MPEFYTILARKIAKLPEIYMIFARKMPKFYITIAQKIYLPNFFEGEARALPAPISYAYVCTDTDTCDTIEALSYAESQTL